MNYKSIKFHKNGFIGIISLNRPERMNAVIEEMYTEIQDALQLAERDVTIKVLILTGSVLKKGTVEKQAFCAGADLKEHSTGKRSAEQKKQYILLAHDTTYKIYDFPKPIIASINGPARGAGAEMALNCDFIIMAHSATIAFPEIGLGTFVGGGVTSHLLSNVGMMKAKELLYTGKVIDGHDAVDLGLALQSVPVENLYDTTFRFAALLSEKAPLSLQFAKKQLRHSRTGDVKTALMLETEAILECMETEDWLEGVNAFIEKRKPIYKGK